MNFCVYDLKKKKWPAIKEGEGWVKAVPLRKNNFFFRRLKFRRPLSSREEGVKALAQPLNKEFFVGGFPYHPTSTFLAMDNFV